MHTSLLTAPVVLARDGEMADELLDVFFGGRGRRAGTAHCGHTPHEGVAP